ncbi:MAG: helix-turn-helix transcriptional regulator [Chloroflexi bacterium]|nr:helix-turn-helix transcriptional regulator [Chloroflexota bacterium]
MTSEERETSPVGTPADEAAQRRVAASAVYRAARARLEPYEAIARQVIALRARHGLSQEELAARIGTSHSQISRIESGQHKSSVETLRRLAEAFHTDLVVRFEPHDQGRRLTQRVVPVGV